MKKFVFEGVDNVGKSYAISVIKESLKRDGFSVRVIRSPYLSISKRILAALYLKKYDGQRVYLKEIQLLVILIDFFIQFLVYLHTRFLEKPDVLLFDRSFLSLCAYQSRSYKQTILFFKFFSKIFHYQNGTYIILDSTDSKKKISNPFEAYELAIRKVKYLQLFDLIRADKFFFLVNEKNRGSIIDKIYENIKKVAR